MQHSSVIARRQLLARAEDALLYQQSPGVYAQSGYVPGGYVSRHINVVAQPPSEAVSARVLPEGTRVAGIFTFYVVGDLNVAPLRTGALPTGRDIIRHASVNYRVASVEPWGVYAMVYAIRLDVQDGPIPAGARSAVRSGGDEALSGGDVVVA